MLYIGCWWINNIPGWFVFGFVVVVVWLGGRGWLGGGVVCFFSI